jgi:hypothetical protein
MRNFFAGRTRGGGGGARRRVVEPSSRLSSILSVMAVLLL